MRNAKRWGRFSLLGFGLVLTLTLSQAVAQGAATASLPTSLHNGVFGKGEALLLKATVDTASLLNGGYSIDSNGYADLPIVGRVEIVGHSREEVENYLSAKLANYLRDTHIKVEPAIRLTLLGSWERPGQYYVSPNATLFDAIWPSGGIAGERTLDQIRVQRGESTTGISFLTAYSSGVSLAQAGIRSGDLIVIPIPRDNTGFWYWFTQSLTATAQVAAIVSAVLSTYITYQLIDSQN